MRIEYQILLYPSHTKYYDEQPNTTKQTAATAQMQAHITDAANLALMEEEDADRPEEDEDADQLEEEDADRLEEEANGDQLEEEADADRLEEEHADRLEEEHADQQ
eukprot:jgi/Psemu1/45986/gm1.45986_g